MVEEIATRVIVLGKDHNIEADGEPEKFLFDPDFLLRTNLIHEHSHRHKTLLHRHPHSHEHEHEHHEQYRDVAAGYLAYSLGFGSNCSGSVFRWSEGDYGDTRRTCWSIHLAA